MDDDEFLERFKRGPNDPKPSWALSSENLLEEMEQVPLFMTKMPDNPEDNPTLAALQALVYDGPPSEIAANFKNQGNEAFKEGKLNDALAFYEKGLLQSKEGDIGSELKSTLLLNRAAVHLEKKNYGYALKDCKEALAINPTLIKAYFRAAKAFYALDKLEAAYKSCQEALKLDASNADVMKMMDLIKKRIQYYESLANDKKKKQQESLLIENKIKERGILRSTKATPVMLPCPRHELSNIQLAGNNLLWPVLFLYPFYDLSDFIAAFNEQDQFGAHLDAMLTPTPKWDTYQKYKDKGNLKICYKNQAGKVKQVAAHETLGSLIASCGREMVSYQDILVFYIVRMVSEIKS